MSQNISIQLGRRSSELKDDMALRNALFDIKQLVPAPLQKDLERDYSGSFHYINGLVKVNPPQGKIYHVQKFGQ